MSWVWTRVGIVGLVAGCTSFAMAWLVYTASPRRLQNRLLGVLLAVTGIAAATYFGLIYLTDDANTARSWAYAGVVFNVATYCLYPAFLSTLPTPLARPLIPLRPIFYACAALAPLLVFTTRGAFIAGLTPAPYAPYEAAFGPGITYLGLAGVSLGVLGLVLSVSSFRRAPRGTLRRDQARAYLTAFGVIEGSVIFITIFAALVYRFGGGAQALLRVGEFVNLEQTISLIVFSFLLAYGMLTTQLFDLQLKLKKGAGRTAVIGLIAATFFVVSYTAEALLPVDGFLPGLIGAGILAATFVPMQRAAIRILDHVFPNVEDTPAYRRQRKEAVYAAAFEELARDGRISDQDRAQLERLRTRLGLPQASRGAGTTSAANR
jgi:hypothetical protein